MTRSETKLSVAIPAPVSGQYVMTLWAFGFEAIGVI